jgi:outer membrane protein TolC
MCPCEAILMMKIMTRSSRRLVALAAVLSATRAHALEPLQTFLEGARTASTDNRKALATERQRGEEAQESLGSVLPSLSASATALRNEREVSLTVNGNELNIQPRNQGYGSASVSIPLVDLAGWAHYSAARSMAKAARESTRATRLTTEGRVAYAYFQLVGARSLSRARVRSLATSEQNLDLTRSRRAAGTATALDVARAEAEVESVRQKLADANLAAALARRTLLTLTGVEAGEDGGELSDALRAEPPLAWWRTSAEAEARAARLAFVPTLTADASQTLASSGGLTGQTSYYALSANLKWNLGFDTFARKRARSAAAQASRIGEEAAVATVRDDLHEQWQNVDTGLVKSRSARAQAASAKLAAEVARERYGAGASTHLELVQAERDLLDAEAARVQADANLAYSRVALRLTAGLDPTDRADASAQPANP